MFKSSIDGILRPAQALGSALYAKALQLDNNDEAELNVVTKQCLNRRMDDIARLRSELFILK